MSHLEEALIAPWSGPKLIAWSFAIGFVGVLPLLVYIAFGPSDGNPIGLGLLAVLAVLLAVVGSFVGLIKWIIQLVRSGGG